MNGSLQERIDDLTQRLARLDAERGVIDTLNRYGHSIDYGDEASWVDCFAADGVFDLHMGARPAALAPHHRLGEPHERGVRFVGQAALASFVAGHTRAPAAWHKHFLVEPSVTISPDGQHATARSYFARLDLRDQEPVITAFGRYLDELELEPDGRWRIRVRIAEIETSAARNSRPDQHRGDSPH
jgi:SnoaL-like protein